MIVDLFAGPGGAPGECWEGAGSDNGNGYRTVRVNGRNAYLHRLSYEAARGPIPEASVIDHLCRNARCVNASHMEPVTQGENTRRAHLGTTRTPKAG